MLPNMRWEMKENCQPMLHLPTGVWQHPHLCENTYLVTCKIPRGFKIGRIILFMSLLLYSFPQGLIEVMVGTDLCNPTSHLEQDCLQYQIMSAGALAAQSLITAVGGDVTTFCVTCSSSVYPPSSIFLRNIQSEPHQPQYGTIALSWQYQEEWPRHHRNSPSNPMGRSL